MATTWKTAAKVVRLLFLSCNGMRNMVLLKLKEITMTLNPEAPMQKENITCYFGDSPHSLSTFSILCFHNLQGNAKVINYAGIVRGATQRLVKEELNGIPNDLLIEKLDGILEELQSGKGVYGLIRMNSSDFQDLILRMETDWNLLKEEIYLVQSRRRYREAL